jgi:hypothetical protein
LRNKSRGAGKEVLASWVSKALKKGLSKSNIKSGFRATGIFTFNAHAMDDKMGSNAFYRQVPMTKPFDLAAQTGFEAVDLAVPKNSYTVQNNSNDEAGSPHAATMASTEEENSEDGDGYASEEEADYLERLEAALHELEAPYDGTAFHYYVPTVDGEGDQEASNQNADWNVLPKVAVEFDKFLVLPQEDSQWLPHFP